MKRRQRIALLVLVWCAVLSLPLALQYIGVPHQLSFLLGFAIGYVATVGSLEIWHNQ
jgi:hypothetical protein